MALSVFSENKEMGFMMFAEFAPMTIKPHTCALFASFIKQKIGNAVKVTNVRNIFYIIS